MVKGCEALTKNILHRDSNKIIFGSLPLDHRVPPVILGRPRSEKGPSKDGGCNVKKILAMFVAVLLLGVTMVPAYAAGPEDIESEMDSAIERAEAYLDSIDVSEIKAQFESMGEFWQMVLGGAPTILMVVVGFALLFFVLRKVLGR